MNREKRRKIAKEIAKLEQQENNISNIKDMENLIKDCSMEDLLKIDELIMRRYLTN